MRRLSALVAGLFLLLVVAIASVAARQAAQPAFTPPRGLMAMAIPVPSANPMTAARIALGKQLFFDPRLSRTKKMSCETCHVPEKGWTDGLALSPRFDGSLNTRHTPTLYGVAYYPELYWDGRSKGLEAQILAAWKSQMGADPDAIAADLNAVPAYKAAFEKEFGGPATGPRVIDALATFVRTIHAGDTEWDRMKQDPASLKQTAAGRGFIVFSEVAHCTNCHLPPLLSDTLFHNVGIGYDKETPDPGRGKVATEDPKMMGAFKTPSLRGVELSGPYFHDGQAKTLEAAVDVMLKGGIKNPNLDEKMQVWPVTPQQRRELLAFLRTLTPADAKSRYPRPTLPSGS
ncbi:MAG: cytochrome-c peroxidase [Vicinamibacterales bacterium]